MGLGAHEIVIESSLDREGWISFFYLMKKIGSRLIENPPLLAFRTAYIS